MNLFSYAQSVFSQNEHDHPASVCAVRVSAYTFIRALRASKLFVARRATRSTRLFIAHRVLRAALSCPRDCIVCRAFFPPPLWVDLSALVKWRAECFPPSERHQLTMWIEISSVKTRAIPRIAAGSIALAKCKNAIKRAARFYSRRWNAEIHAADISPRDAQL